MRIRVIIAVIGCVLLGVGSWARAAEGSKDTTVDVPKPQKKAKQTPFRGKVGAVDKTEMTVTLEGKDKGRTFHVTSESRITKDGNPAVFGEIIAGETVGGAYRMNAAGKMEVVTLNVGKKATKPETGTKKKKKEE